MQFVFRGRRRLAGVLTGVVGAVVLALAVGSGAAGAASQHRSASAAAVNISSIPWGTAHNSPVRLWTLRNGRGMKVRITNYGGVVQSIWVPSRSHVVKNVALGFNNLNDYIKDFEWTPPSGGSGDTYFGAIIGRYANRIANGAFTLNGTTYHLPQNNGPNTLHGGPMAYNTKVWSASEKKTANAVSLILTYTDPDGYNGFPGAVTTTVTYTLDASNAFRIHYGATTTKPTVINYTNHTYFNLAGEGSGDVYGQELRINSEKFTPTNANLIPTGTFASVAGTPFDFRHMKAIGRDIRNASAPEGNQLVLAHGFDHNWILQGGSGLKLAAVALDPRSGRKVTTFTTEPGLQVYTGNFLVGDLVGTSGRTYRQGDAFTLETQHYPDSPNHIGQAGWPSVVLNPGQTFQSTTIFRFAW
jgi:aldose 1-epimerase